MSASVQFSFTTELTKLVPLALKVANKTYEAAMALARALQVSYLALLSIPAIQVQKVEIYQILEFGV